MAAGLFAFFIALFASLFLTVPVRALALRVGMVDLPGPRKVHLQPIPLLGGLAMYAGVVLGVLFLFNGPAREQIEGILAGATLIAAVGILDDRGLLHHQIKLFVGMPLAAGILLLSGMRAQFFNTLFGGRTGDLLDIVLTVVWVVGITASFSILDHMDGLCAGVAAMASAFFALLAYLNGQTLVTVLAAAVLGAASGFLRWNFKPAKIFMGDGGAMFLGFLMATLGLKLRLAESNMLSAWVFRFSFWVRLFLIPRSSPSRAANVDSCRLPHRARITPLIAWRILAWDSAARCSQCTFSAPFPVRSPCLSAFYRSPCPWG